VLPTPTLRRSFIKKCLKRLKTRRMLLRAQWYVEIADGQEKVRQSRPSLRLIFLMAMAEAVAKERKGSTKLMPWEAIEEFFKYISPEDKRALHMGIKRTFLGPRHHNLRFSSILKILYNVRNSAVHGEDFFSFPLMSKKDKEESVGYSSYSLNASGCLGTRKRKKKRVNRHKSDI
ncbi:MAG: hypothetical protein QGG87_05530, partial [Nitrospinota bacterium]|nr:hypothetical protein [Nitrospinota bacterium]